MRPGQWTGNGYVEQSTSIFRRRTHLDECTESSQSKRYGNEIWRSDPNAIPARNEVVPQLMHTEYG